MKFRVKLFISDYIKVGEDYQRIEVESRHLCHSWDDLNNFVDSLVESSEKDTIKLEIKRLEPEVREVE